jgi:hypothetical protein
MTTNILDAAESRAEAPSDRGPTEMSAAISPYSMAVAPASSWRNGTQMAIAS